jgi:hypothetical protein
MSIAEWLFLLLQSGWVSLLDYPGRPRAVVSDASLVLSLRRPGVNILAIAYTGAAIGLPMPPLQEERAVAGFNVMGGQAQ